MLNSHLSKVPENIYPFDARGVAKRFRHAAIFGALDTAWQWRNYAFHQRS